MTLPRSKLYASYLFSHDFFRSWNIPIPDRLKARDPREPGRIIKTEAEDRLFNISMRYFRRTKKRLREFLELHAPERKQREVVTIDDISVDPVFMVELIAFFTQIALQGIELFELETGIILAEDINLIAAQWAQENAGRLVRQVTDFQRRTIAEAVATFAETEGMTIGNVINDLVGPQLFTETRATRIAVTEITSAFANADEIAGQELARQFPGVDVIRTWFTNRDDRVCIRCEPLEGQQVPLGQPFVNDVVGETYMNPGDPHPFCRCWVNTRTVI
jgi:hypothetical protein